MDTTIELGPYAASLVEYVLPTIFAIISLIVGWLAYQAQRLFGLNVEARHREAFQSATANAAAQLLTSLAGRVDGRLDVGSPEVKRAIEYVMTRAAPDATKFFGLSPETVAAAITAQISKLLILERGATGGGTGVAGTVSQP